MEKKLPTLFISHGSPMIAIEKSEAHDFLNELASNIPQPKAIVIFSAHWQTSEIRITGSEYPEQIYDFHGFDDELYEIKYKPRSDLKLANRIKESLNNSGYKAELDSKRGFDHGVWNPLYLLFPKGNIPVVQISLTVDKDAAYFYEIGSRLSWLRDENILVIGSGNMTHNLREAFRGSFKGTPEWVNKFADWMTDCIIAGNVAELLEWKRLAPYAKENHPTDEHLLPLFAALGAAGKNAKAKHLHESTSFNVLRMDGFSFV